MSVKVMGLVWDARQLTQPTVTLVMLTLADYASHDGSRIFPSVETLAAKTRLGRRQVQRILRRLEDAGLLRMVHEATPRLPREYQINLAALDAWGGSQAAPNGHPRGDSQAAPGVTSRAFRGDSQAAPGAVPRPPYPSVELTTDPSVDPLSPPAAGSEPAFELFYSRYSKKQGKEAAARAWKRLAPDAALTDKILAALAAQTASEEWRRERGRFIPRPAKWLNSRRWEDQPLASIPDRHHVNDAWAGKTEGREVEL